MYSLRAHYRGIATQCTCACSSFTRVCEETDGVKATSSRHAPVSHHMYLRMCRSVWLTTDTRADRAHHDCEAGGGSRHSAQ
eukprot:4064719-Pyramimonas_sp.AAC.1